MSGTIFAVKLLEKIEIIGNSSYLFHDFEKNVSETSLILPNGKGLADFQKKKTDQQNFERSATVAKLTILLKK